MAKQGVKTAEVEVNAADLTAEQCVAAVWEAFDASSTQPGLIYDILPKGMTGASFWLMRLPWIGSYFVRCIFPPPPFSLVSLKGPYSPFFSRSSLLYVILGTSLAVCRLVGGC